MSDNDIIRNLFSALQFAEATLMKMKAGNLQEDKWQSEAIERAGKAIADAMFHREVRS